MPSIINSDDGQVSGSAGLKFTSADDGILQIQNNGVDAMTVSASGEVQTSVIQASTIKSATGNTALTISDDGVIFAAPPRLPAASIPFLIITSSSTASPVYSDWAERTVGYGVPVVGNSIGSGTFSGGRYTPDVPGLYQVNVIAQTGASAIATFGAGIYLNGSLYRFSYSRLNTSINTNGASSVSDVVRLNGNTDFVSGGYYMGATSGVTSIGIWFSVCLLQRIA